MKWVRAVANALNLGDSPGGHAYKEFGYSGQVMQIGQ